LQTSLSGAETTDARKYTYQQNGESYVFICKYILIMLGEYLCALQDYLISVSIRVAFLQIQIKPKTRTLHLFQLRVTNLEGNSMI